MSAKLGCVWDKTAEQCQKSICNNENSASNCNNKHGCYYDSDDDGNNCEVCPKGYCCPAGNPKPQPCTAGYYCPLTGLSNCSTEGFKCPEDSYCPAGSYDYISCPNAYPNSDEGSTKQTDCYWYIPEGYQFSTAANGNVQCTAGGYCPYEIKINYPDERKDTWGRAPCNECTDPVNCPVVIKHTPDYDGQVISSNAGAITEGSCYAECRDISIEHGKKTANPQISIWVKGVLATRLSPTNETIGTKYVHKYDCNYTLTCDTGYKVSASDERGSTEFICAAQKYTVSYDCGEGSGTAPNNGTATYDSNFTPASNTCTKTGYTFDGWTVSGTSDVKNTAFKWQYTENKTLTARWRVNTYNLSYVLNGAKDDGGSRPATATYDEFFYVSTPSKTGYAFMGWNITGMDTTGHDLCLADNTCISSIQSSVNYTTYIYFKNLTAVDNATVIFTAQWIPNVYSIEYELNGGTFGTGSHPATAEFDQTFTVDHPSKTGYTFDGWEITGMDSVTHTYGSNTTTETSISDTKETSFKNLHSTQDATVTFTAKWTANTYTVTLNQNGGTGGESSVTATYDSPMPSLSNLPTRNGYMFKGYYDAQTGGKQYYTVNGTSAKLWDKAGTATLYARWTVISYELTYDCGIGTDTVPRLDGCKDTITTGFSEMIDYDASFTVRPISTVDCKNPGYRFTGWRDNNDKVYKSNDIQTWNHTTDQTFTAQWTACDAGTYCSGDSNTAESCTDIASIFTSADKSCKKTQCYINTDTVLVDDLGKKPLGDLAGDSKIYYINNTNQ